MRITFLMPGDHSFPSGGFRVVYEYANRLVSRGHQVTVLHPRKLKYAPPERFSVYRWLRRSASRLTTLASRPSIDWHRVDPRVRLLYIPSSDVRYIPQGEAVFATGWVTVQSVLECPADRGENFYLIQGYEGYHAPKELVDATWRAPLHKIVVSKWLLEVGKTLGCHDLTHIPNAIDHERYRIVRPLASRSRQVAMLCSRSPVKGSIDGFEALRIARDKYPDLKTVAFGTSRRQAGIPEWIEYHQNPPQEVIVNEIYNCSSVFLSSSLSEGFSLPPAEAAACGCAVVATDSGGIREYIQSGVSGLLSPPKDPGPLAENLCLLLGNEDLRVRIATACNEGLRQFNWDRSAALMDDYIARAQKRTGSGQAQPLSLQQWAPAPIDTAITGARPLP